MALPYTQRFLAFAGPGGALEYTVPAGYRIVIRAFTVHNSGGTTDSCALWLLGAPVYSLKPGPDAGAAVATHIVAYSGEVVTVTWTANAMAGTVSGYIFADPAGPIGRQELADRAELLPAELGANAVS